MNASGVISYTETPRQEVHDITFMCHNCGAILDGEAVEIVPYYGGFLARCKNCGKEVCLRYGI